MCDDRTVGLLLAISAVRSLPAALLDDAPSSRPDLPCLCLLTPDLTPDPDTVDGPLRYQVFLSTKKSSDFVGMRGYLETARCFQVRLQKMLGAAACPGFCAAGMEARSVQHCAHMLGQSLGAHGSYGYCPHLMGASFSPFHQPRPLLRAPCPSLRSHWAPAGFLWPGAPPRPPPRVLHGTTVSAAASSRLRLPAVSGRESRELWLHVFYAPAI